MHGHEVGESRVVRWKSERPGLDEDEFIDDIPFPETQNYVKRILGTAEDYRRLYGESGAEPIRVAPAPARSSSVAPKSSSKTAAPKKSTSSKKKSTAAKSKPSAKKKRPVKKTTGGG